jgi:two-component system torCAD operon response regulator TorR
MEIQQLGDHAIGMNVPEPALDQAKLVLICSKADDLGHLEGALERYGFIVQHSEDISSVENIASSSTVNVIIIDGTFLYFDTALVIRRLLLLNDRPGILVRSGSNDDIDRIVALDMGADDCVDESCSAREIGARAAAITRRASVRSEIIRESGRLEFAGWELYADRRQLLTPAKNTIHLTGTEYSILICLLSNPGSVKSRSDLRYNPDTGDDDDGDPRTMDVLVSRLRKKMMSFGDENIIETVRGFGYRLITR